MPHYTITSDTQTQGPITKRIWEENYMDAMIIMDNIVDQLDGWFEWIDNPPLTLAFDELLSGQYGGFHNYADRGERWQIILVTGWVYTGNLDSDIGERCSRMNKLDTVMMHY